MIGKKSPSKVYRAIKPKSPGGPTERGDPSGERTPDVSRTGDLGTGEEGNSHATLIRTPSKTESPGGAGGPEDDGRIRA